MAVSRHATSAPTTPLSRRFDNVATERAEQAWPAGACNFINLNIGGNTPLRCGCLRFWKRTANARGAADDSRVQQDTGPEHTAWCMCNHHACYHETAAAVSAAPVVELLQTVDTRAAQEDDQQSVFGISYPQEYGNHVSKQNKLGSIVRQSPLDCLNPHGGLEHLVLPDSELPDTEGWSNALPSNAINAGLPSIPDQCLLPLDVSSGGLSGDCAAFQALLDHENEAAVKDQHVPNPVSVPSGIVDLGAGNSIASTAHVDPDSFQETATNAFTPSPRQSPELGSDPIFTSHIRSVQEALRALDGPSIGRQEDTCPSATALSRSDQRSPLDSTTISQPRSFVEILRPIRQILPPLQHILAQVNALPRLTTRAQNHERRIDRLENASYTNAAVEELSEVVDRIDERQRDLESKVDDIERAQALLCDVNSHASFHRSHQIVNDGLSMISEGSSMSMMLNNTEVLTRLAELEARISPTHLDLIGPTHLRPWHLEVIFLPFGTHLKGIWSAAETIDNEQHFSKCGSPPGQVPRRHEDHTQTAQQSAPETRLFAWQGIMHLQDTSLLWQTARACGQNSVVEQRLRSRGFIKTLRICGPDARDVDSALSTGFCDILATLSTNRMDGGLLADKVPSMSERFLALQSSWLPLRKLHKDSRLRHLTPSEMVTPALWTVPFLSSSVVMRAAGVQRLFVTQPSAYLQRAKGDTGWTWQRLRELPRVSHDPRCSMDVQEADAMEQCWQYDSRLDVPPSLHSSFASQHASLSIRQATQGDEEDSSSDDCQSLTSAMPSPVLSTSPTSVNNAYPSSPILERQPFRPLHLRTTSMPATCTAPLSSPSSMPTKRRIASYEREHEAGQPHRSPQSSPLVLTTVLVPPKRRRLSRSPSRPRDTPRWSIEPPSLHVLTEDIKRGTTPFAYATPHSNVPYHDNHVHQASNAAAHNQAYGDEMESLSLPAFEDQGFETNVSSLYESNLRQNRRMKEDVWEGVIDNNDEADDHHDKDEDEIDIDDYESDSDDAEQRALSDDDDNESNASQASSRPSEYPSTQRASAMVRYASGRGNFCIHVDHDDDEDQDQDQDQDEHEGTDEGELVRHE